MSFGTIKKNKNIFSDVIEFTMCTCVVFTLITFLLKEKILGSGYHLHGIIFFRLMAFFSVVGAAICFPLLRPFGINNIVKGRLDYSNLINSFLIIALILSIFLSNFIPGSSYIICIGIITIYFYSIWNSYYVRILEGIKYRSLILISLCLLITLLPLTSEKYLNSESNPNIQELQVVEGKIFKHNDLENDYVEIALDEISEHIVNTNINKIKFRYDQPLLTPYRIRKSNGNTIIDFYLNRGSLHNICIFINYEDQHVNNTALKNIDECIKYFSNLGNTGDYNQIGSALTNFPFTSYLIANQFFEQIKAIDFNNRFLLSSEKVSAQLHLMVVRGGVSHHYDYILFTIRNAITNFDLFTNQYGFGPLIIVKEISKALGLTLFDSLFMSISIVSMLFLLIVILFLRNDDNFHKILIGYFMTILVTYATSSFLAPFLYPIRYLPSLLLILFAYANVRNGYPLKKLDILLFGLLSFLVSMYNFEYGLLTAIAMIIAGFYTKEKIGMIIGIMIFILCFSTKILPGVSLSKGMGYLPTIAGIGQGSSFSYDCLLFLVSVLIVSYLFLHKKNLNKNYFYITFIYIVLILFSFKVVWTGASNHIGALFFILFIFIASLVKLDKIKSYKDQKLVSILYFLIFVIALISIVKLTANTQPGHKFNEVNYVKSEFSNLFKISDANFKKVKSFKEVYRDDDLLISQNDHLLALSVGKLLTKPYPNISTNINSPVDESDIYFQLVKDKKFRIIVDKAIIDTDILDYFGQNLIGVNSAIDGQIKAYIYENNRLRSLYKKILNSSFYETCQENDMFLIICPKSI